MAIEVREEDLAATPGEGKISVALNNLHGRFPGGYKRRLLNTPHADVKMRDSGGATEPGRNSELRLNQTTREFFATIDGLLTGLGLSEARAAELAKAAGTSARTPEMQAALTEYERIGLEVYRALKLMGYTDSDIVG
jgi:hypothetical protein